MLRLQAERIERLESELAIAKANHAEYVQSVRAVIERLEAELATVQANYTEYVNHVKTAESQEIERLNAEVKSLDAALQKCNHGAPTWDPTNADEALRWIEQDRGYGMWSATDADRFGDAVQMAREELERLRSLIVRLCDTCHERGGGR